MSRHPNEKPFEINRGGAERGTGQHRMRNKRAKSAEIESLTQDFLANGGKVKECPSGETGNPWNPAFNQPPEESLYGGS